jgi:hypothetical protein
MRQGVSVESIPVSADPTVPMWQAPMAYTSGGLLIVAGLMVLGMSRGLGLDRLRIAGRSLTRPTAGALGLAFLVVGYHVAVWPTPLRFLTIHVPADLWWVVVCGAVLAVAASVAVDRLEGA